MEKVMQTYQTISGRTLDLTGADPAKIAFLERFQSVASTSTHNEMIALGYGVENPIMDLDAIPGRGAVTAEVIFTPAYRTMTDILFRKQMQEQNIAVEELAKQFTLTPAEAAERLGVTVGAVRQAIDAGRLGVWMKGGRAFITPRSLAAFRMSPRGPKARQARASTRPLAFCAGRQDAAHPVRRRADDGRRERQGRRGVQDVRGNHLTLAASRRIHRLGGQGAVRGVDAGGP